MTCLFAAIGWLLVLPYRPRDSLWMLGVLLLSCLWEPVRGREGRRRTMLSWANRTRVWLGWSDCPKCSGNGGKYDRERGKWVACPCQYDPEGKWSHLGS